MNRDEQARRSILRAFLTGTLALAGSRTGQLFGVEVKQQTVLLPKLYRVPLGMQTGRLHEMEPGYDDGCLWFWAGSIGHTLLQYEPGSGKTTRHALRVERHPEGLPSLGRHFYPVAKNGKVYLADLRQPTNFLPVYDPDSRRVSFHPLPGVPADERMYIYKGLVSKTGPFLYLFPKNPAGVIQWDTRTDTGQLIRFPYGQGGPWSGVLSDGGKIIWCPLWDNDAIARFDVTRQEWTGYWPSRSDGSQPSSAGLIGEIFYAPDLARPRLLRFDTAGEVWQGSIAAPGHQSFFGILGGGFIYEQKMFCAMSTYKGYIPPGGPLGIDGKPHHFLDRWLCYDPQAKRFAHLVCHRKPDDYWITCYAVVMGRHLYVTAFNARQPDGSIQQGGVGDAAVFQTHPVGRSTDPPIWEEAPAL